MPKYYAYRPTSSGKEPTGTGARELFTLKTDAGATRRAIRSLGKSVCLFSYTNFYDDKTFQRVYGGARCKL